MKKINNPDLFYRLLGIKLSTILSLYKPLSETELTDDITYNYSERSYQRLKEQKDNFDPNSKISFNFFRQMDEAFSSIIGDKESNDINTLFLQFIYKSLKSFPASKEIKKRIQEAQKDRIPNPMNIFENQSIMDSYYNQLKTDKLLSHIIVSDENEQYIKDLLLFVYIQTAIETEINEISSLEVYTSFLSKEVWVTPMKYCLTHIQNHLEGTSLYVRNPD